MIKHLEKHKINYFLIKCQKIKRYQKISKDIKDIS